MAKSKILVKGTAQKPNFTVRLANVRLSYAHLFEKTNFGNENSEPVYSSMLIIDKDDKETVDLLKKVFSFMHKNSEKIKGKKNVRLPLRDGDAEKPNNADLEGKYFMNAKSKYKPEVVGRYMDPETKKPIPLTEDEVYSGCYANVSVNFYAYDSMGNKGIGVGLGNVQKMSDGEKLAGGSSAESDFDYEEPEEYDLDGAEEVQDDDNPFEEDDSDISWDF